MQEKFINDREVLIAAADKVGLSGARAFLAEPDNGRLEVQQMMASYPRSISGVPHFVIDGSVHVSGAQPPESFVQIFNSILA